MLLFSIWSLIQWKSFNRKTLNMKNRWKNISVLFSFKLDVSHCMCTNKKKSDITIELSHQMKYAYIFFNLGKQKPSWTLITTSVFKTSHQFSFPHKPSTIQKNHTKHLQNPQLGHRILASVGVGARPDSGCNWKCLRESVSVRSDEIFQTWA